MSNGLIECSSLIACLLPDIINTGHLVFSNFSQLFWADKSLMDKEILFHSIKHHSKILLLKDLRSSIERFPP
jgi:hypothetical protein